MSAVFDVLGRVRSKGVRLWSDNGKLRYTASKGTLTREEIEQLAASRRKVVALLEREAGALLPNSRMEPSEKSERVPLAFSQLAHWNLYQLGERLSLGLLSCQIQLSGPLNIGALKKGVECIVRHHDALRTRIVVCDGVPAQEVSGSADCEIQFDDLNALPADRREPEVVRLIVKYSNEAIDVTRDPLFGVRLLKISDTEHVLILTLDHIVADGFSMNIVLRHLLMAYGQAVRGEEIVPPSVPIQFADYAAWQNETQQAWIHRHGTYWRERMAGCKRVSFPSDKSNASTGSGWGLVPIVIGRETKTQLHEWCRSRRNTLVMSVFTAYIALVMRWCDVTEGVILYQSDGRVSEKVRETVGYFAAPLFLRMELLENDSFTGLMSRVTEEYCRAYEHADFSWLEAQVPRPEFTRNGCFNWLPRAVASDDDLALETADDSLTWSSISVEQLTIENFERDTEPMVGLVEVEEEIRGWVMFPLNRFSNASMEAFASNLLAFIDALLKWPDMKVKDVQLRT